ncbi:MAG: AbgT family transporter [Verrucomicrobiota bacterium]
MQTPAATESSRTRRFLGGVERVGNALPHPATMFALLAAVVVVMSAVFSAAGVEVVHPTNGQTIRAVNLLSVAGLQRMVLECGRNFVLFPPLGASLLCLLGLGVAEHSGMIRAALRLMVAATARRWITPMTVLVGVLSNSASEVGYVLVIPLAAALFHALGRHPLLGLAAAFAGVSGGYSANLLIGSVDVLLAGLSESAARIVDPAYVVRPTANYYFMTAATVLLTIVGTWVTEKWVAPRLGGYAGEAAREPLAPLESRERRGLMAAAATVLIFAAVVGRGLLPAGGFLLNPTNPDFGASAFVMGLVTFIFLFGLLPGIAYGIVAGTLRNDHDVVRGMTEAMKSLGGYIVLAFFAAQFIAYFNWTNLGVITAIGGAEAIHRLGVQHSPTVLVVALVLCAAAVNLVIASASAKWALMAPVFVPMFMLLGVSPELAQAAYGVGDSVTNIITPMMPYFPLVLTFAQRYEPKAGIGTLAAIMLPYSAMFLLTWTLLLVVWVWLGLPVGPGAGLFLAR